MDFIQVTHPVLGTTTVPASRLPYLNTDWKRTQTLPDDYDPAKNNRDDVLTYLADADPTEVARVLDLERGGKARSTVLAFEPEPSPDPTAAPSVAAPLTETTEV